MKFTILLMVIGLVGYIINNNTPAKTAVRSSGSANIIILFISIEIMLLGVTVFILLSGYHNDDMLGLVIGIIVLIVTGIESALGLTILINYYKLKGSLPAEI